MTEEQRTELVSVISDDGEKMANGLDDKNLPLFSLHQIVGGHVGS